MKQTGTPATFDPKARTVVVIAGAAARGPYEAAALASVLPALFGDDLSNVVLLGTSAGAINAALWAARLGPNMSTSEVGSQVQAIWSEITQRRVFNAYTAGTALLRMLSRGVAAFLLHTSWNLMATYRMLDTRPLDRTARAAFDDASLKRNVDEGRLLGVGAVATHCPMDGSGGRSRVFLYGRPELYAAPGLSKPPSGSSIDYVLLDSSLRLEHILASAAIPVAFEPVQIQEPSNYAGWYTDGGVRLNTPIRPALDMDASQLIVISSLATSYPEVSPGEVASQPNILDVSAQAIHTVLGDGTIEDLRALQRINHLVAQAQNSGLTLVSEQGRPYRVVKFLTVSPENDVLSAIAQDQLAQASSACCSLSYRMLAAALRSAGVGAGYNELASYILFYPEYAVRQFEQAMSDVARKGPLQDAFVT